MVTASTQYTCDICHKTFNNEESALRCESRGKPKPFPLEWQGLIFTHSIYKDDCLFTLPEEYFNEVGLETKIVEGHFLKEHFYATRSGGFDSLDSICGAGSYLGEYPMKQNIPLAVLNTDHFHRMVRFVSSKGWTPKVRIDGVIYNTVDVCGCIHSHDDKWWFWDEVQVDEYGPFDTVTEAQAAMLQYCKDLEIGHE